MRCVQLTDDQRCSLFGDPSRPAVCSSLKPHPSMCGSHRDEAIAWLTELERQTDPCPAAHPAALLPPGNERRS
jgi:hypothetical protein